MLAGFVATYYGGRAYAIPSRRENEEEKKGINGVTVSGIFLCRF